MENNSYSIYIHKNKINNKVYIGQTSNLPQRRWGSKGSCYSKKTIFGKAIKKYGWDNFEHQILMSNLTKEQADFIENMLIKSYNSTDRKYGYNQKEGGSNGKWTESEKDKIRGCGNPFYGKKHTVETKEKLRLSSLGEKNHFFGKHHTDETKQKISIAKKGCSVWNKGIPRSEETKRKIREKKLGQISPFFGKGCPSKKNINISKNQLEELYINKNHTAKQIAEEMELSVGFVYSRIRYFNIFKPIDKKKEVYKKRQLKGRKVFNNGKIKKGVE